MEFYLSIFLFTLVFSFTLTGLLKKPNATLLESMAFWTWNKKDDE